jgi:hypothetical protein
MGIKTDNGLIDWRISREMYLKFGTKKTNTEVPDSGLSIEDNMQDVLDHALDYFYIYDYTCQYPSKSFAVGVLYATLISKFYGEDVIDLLATSDLLTGDDFFIPYGYSPEADFIYDKMLITISNTPINNTLPQVRETIDCFFTEIMSLAVDLP